MQGLEEGKAQGLQEAKRNIAKTLLASNFSIDYISQITGLPLDEVKKIIIEEKEDTLL